LGPSGVGALKARSLDRKHTLPRIIRMGKIVVITNLTLDGVMQAPGHSDEDARGGFEYGGWAAPFAAMQQPEAGAAFANMGALLFGRLTYERFYAFWPNQTDNPF